jgi:hypothetical protein
LQSIQLSECIFYIMCADHLLSSDIHIRRGKHVFVF